MNAEIARLLPKIQEFPTDEQIEQLERQLDRILSEIENMGAGKNRSWNKGFCLSSRKRSSSYAACWKKTEKRKSWIS